jgi:hypothetical protein
MTPWQQAFESQQFVTKIDGILDSLKAASTKGMAQADLEQFARLVKAMKFVRGRIKSIDPELVSQTSLNNIGSWLSTIANSLQHFTTTTNTTYIQSANTTLDSVIDVVRSFRTTSRDHEQVVATAATAFRDKAIEEIEGVRAERIAVDGELAAQKKDLSQVRTALTESNKVIEQQKGRLDQSIAEFQKQFSQSEAERSKEFTGTVTKLSAQVTAQTARFEQQFVEDVKQRKEKGDQYLSFLKEREKQVNEIFGAIGSASLAGHFKKTADEQEKIANRYRLIALGLMTGMIVIAGISFYHTLSQAAPDWKLFGFRLATSVVLLIPALYAARESAKHRTREGRLRKSHLELASIDAYLALLPEDKRNELKEKLTDKFFGQAEPVEKDEMVSGHALLQVIEMALKNLTSGK